MNSLKTKLLDKTANFLVRKERFRDLFLDKSREKLYKEYFAYPSHFNNGYMHIERVIEIAKKEAAEGMDKKIIVDAGAASGIITTIFFQHFPSDNIYSFEPVQNTFQTLLKRVNGISGIHTRNKALGNSNCTMQINKASRITSSSLFPIDTNISNDFLSVNLKADGDEMISVAKMDDELPSFSEVRIIKIDVQGYELEVLKGGVETLKRTHFILLEMQNHESYIGAPKYYDLDNFLRIRGFELFDIIPSIRLDDKLYEWDAIYRNKKF